MVVSELEILAQLSKKRALKQFTLSEEEGKQFLHSAGIGVPEGVTVKQTGQAQDAAERLGFPLVVKGLVQSITHKSDHGLVKTGVANERDLEAAFTQISAKCAEMSAEWEILVEQQIARGLEFVVGVTTDETFGKVLMFGLGGIFVEVIKDVSFKLCPIERKDAHDMINSLRGRKIFSGVRGEPRVDEEKIADFLMRIGGEAGIACRYADMIDTLEINPAVIDAEGRITALDAVMKLTPESGTKAPAKHMSQAAFERLFNPESIGIVGISPGKPSLAKDFMTLLAKHGYKGKIYPINHNHDGKEIDGWRIYDRISAVPDHIDYLYVSVPSGAVPNVLNDGKGKVHIAQIISSGFSETGEAGRESETALLDVSRKAGIRLIGPNCLGMYSSSARVAFVPGSPLEPGPVSIISQSGGISTEILRTGGARGIRFNQAVSIGNSVDLGIEDFLEYMGGDDKTEVIGLYAEYVKNGARLSSLLKEICPKKPVVVFKGGRGELGAKAASSHTGALSSNYGLWEAMCRQHGATLVKTFNTFLNMLMAFQGLVPSPDNSLFLVSHSGGLTVTGADLCEEYALAVPELEEDLQRQIFALGIPPGASIKNPVDIPLGTLAARTRAGEKLEILRDMFALAGSRKPFAYDVLYLMTDNMIVSGNGASMIKDLFDLVIELAGNNGRRHKRFVLAVNYSIEPELIAKECSRAAKAGILIFRDLADALQSVAQVIHYGARFRS